jgi:transcriptional regulator with XRE-family HTH domain
MTGRTNLGRLIDASGRSLASVAGDCRIHPSAMSRWVNGHYKPNARNAAVLAVYFNVSVATIMGEETLPYERTVRVTEV